MAPGAGESSLTPIMHGVPIVPLEPVLHKEPSSISRCIPHTFEFHMSTNIKTVAEARYLATTDKASSVENEKYAEKYHA